MTLDELLENIEGRADRQRVCWFSRPWRSRSRAHELGWESVIEQLEVSSQQGPGRKLLLSRQDVVGIAAECLGKVTSTELLVACCVWGFGRHPKGRARTERMTTSPGAGGILEEIIEASRTSAVAGFVSLFEDWRPRIKGLGVAFGTKLVHFAAGDAVDPVPLIYDRFVSLALQEIEGPSFPLAHGRVRSSDYERYVHLAREAAGTHGLLPEDVEYALFQYGKTLTSG